MKIIYGIWEEDKRAPCQAVLSNPQQTKKKEEILFKPLASQRNMVSLHTKYCSNIKKLGSFDYYCRRSLHGICELSAIMRRLMVDIGKSKKFTWYGSILLIMGGLARTSTHSKIKKSLARTTISLENFQHQWYSNKLVATWDTALPKWKLVSPRLEC